MDSPLPATAAEAADSQPATDGPMGLADVPCSDDSLSSRWTPEQKERARDIVNDIAEDIDNGESREVLREALAIYADFLWDSHQFKGDTLLEKTLVALQALERTQSQNVEIRGAELAASTPPTRSPAFPESTG